MVRRFIRTTSSWFVANHHAKFEIERIKQKITLSTILFVSGVAYSISFLPARYVGLFLITLLNSLWVLLIPFVIRFVKSAAYQYTIYFLVGLSFAVYNIFGCGNHYSIAVILWFILIVNLAFVLMNHKIGLLFGLIVASLLIAKQAFIDSGFIFPYWIPQVLIESPRSIDIALPAFLNLLIIYSNYELYERSISALKQSNREIQLLNRNLNTSRREYWTIVEKSHGYIFTHSLSGQLRFVNASMSRALAKSADEFKGTSLKSIFPDFTDHEIKIYLSKIKKRGQAEGLFPIMTSQGLRYYSFKSSLFSEEEGEPLVICFAVDVTEQEENRQQIIRNEEELEVAISSISDVVVLIDNQKSIFKCWTNLDFLPQANQCLAKKMEIAFSTILNEQTHLLLQEYEEACQRFTSREIVLSATLNGVLKWLHFKISPIKRSALNIQASIHIRDITQQYIDDEASTRQLEKLQRYQNCLGRLSRMDLAAEGLLDQTLRMICEETAKAMQIEVCSYWEFLPYKDELECKVIFGEELFSHSNAQKIIFTKKEFPSYFRLMESGKLICVGDVASEIRNSIFYKKFLEQANVKSFLKVPIFLHGRFHGAFCTEKIGENYFWDHQDISFAESIVTIMSLAIEAHNNKLAEEKSLRYSMELEKKNDEMRKMMSRLAEARKKAEESEKLKSIFLANMSHEIRTPMNAILGFAELLENPKTQEKKRQQFSSLIRERAQDLWVIINNVLDYSILEAGQVSLIEVEGNVDELIERLICGLRLEATYLINKNIILKNKNELQGSDNLIVADFVRLYQVLSNILSNALKFTNHGMVEVGCKQSGDFLLFYVSDTGMGIQKDKASLIFESFRQADETIHQKHGGSGLGLAISKGIVEMWGGQIWVESEFNRGSTFYFTLPNKKKPWNYDWSVDPN
jgi:PAS domain S-box-containing protein